MRTSNAMTFKEQTSGAIGFSARMLLVLLLLFFHERGCASIACSSPPCLLYSNGQSITSLQLASSVQTLVVHNLIDAVAVDVHMKENLVFWTENSAQVIRRANLITGKIEEVITEELGEVGSLSVEWESGLLYWTDVKWRTIEVARLDGSYRKVLLDEGVNKPRAIAVDPRKGFMFWTVEGSQARIERSYLSGEKRTTIVDLTIFHQHWPNGIVIDYMEDRLYWIDAFTDTIESVDFEGGTREHMKTMRDIIHPFGLTILDNVLYWTDWKSVGVEKFDKITSKRLGNHGTLESWSMRGITMIDSSRQPLGKNTCQNSGPCSHLCLLTPNGHQCACPTEAVIQEDGRHCYEGNFKDVLLVSSYRKRKIYRIISDDNNVQTSSLSLTDIQSPSALDFDPEEKMIYWTDVALKRISRAHLDGGDEQVIIDSELLSPEGLAVDTVARNLYWTDYRANRIEVSKLDGSSRKVLISEDLDGPLDVVLDTRRGVMYWSSGGNSPRIERANMDGTDRNIIITFPASTSSHISSPHGLALDPTENRLYCSDLNLVRLQYIDLNNVRPHFITLISNDAYMRRPYGLAIKGGHVYWTDVRLGAVYQANKTTGDEVRRIASVATPRDVLVYPNSAVSTGSSPCANNNGWCTHLCLLRPGGYQCACPRDPTRDRPCFTEPIAPSTPANFPDTNITSSSSSASTQATLGASTSAVVTNKSCDQSTCHNGGRCLRNISREERPCQCPPNYALGNCELYIGADKIKMTFEMSEDEWSRERFQKSLSKALTDYCTREDVTCEFGESPETGAISRRSADDVTFQPEDVIVPHPPDEVKENLEVEAAVVRPLSDSSETRGLVPKAMLCKMVKSSAVSIAEHFGGHKLVYINGKHEPSCDNEGIKGEKSQTHKDKSTHPVSDGGITAIIIGVFIFIFIIVFIATVFHVGNTGYEYKMLAAQENEENTKESPTYEEITPDLISCIKKAENNETCVSTNPVRRTENVYSEVESSKVSSREKQNNNKNNANADVSHDADGKKENVHEETESVASSNATKPGTLEENKILETSQCEDNTGIADTEGVHYKSSLTIGCKEDSPSCATKTAQPPPSDNSGYACLETRQDGAGSPSPSGYHSLEPRTRMMDADDGKEAQPRLYANSEDSSAVTESD